MKVREIRKRRKEPTDEKRINQTISDIIEAKENSEKTKKLVAVAECSALQYISK